MEPLLELIDRITAHVWLFERACPTDAASLLAAKDPLWQGATEQYASLQALADLYDPQGQTGDAKNPLAWVKAEQRPKTFLGAVADAVVPSKALSTKSQEEQKRIRATNATDILDALGRRIELLEILWQRNHERRVNQADLDRISSGETFREFCKARSSDAMFRRIASWIASDELNTEERILLAKMFFPVTLSSRNVRFLIEDALDERAKQIVGFGIEKSWHRAAEPIPNERSAAMDWQKKDETERLEVLLCRNSLRNLCRDIDSPVPFSMVFSDELDEIARSRWSRLQLPPATHLGNDATTPTQSDGCCASVKELSTERAFRANLFGVALSGGGIRSATFALGLFQAMADRNVLPYIDVLSCVSGGGYFGSWLMAWIKRRGSVNEVQESLRGNATSRIIDNVPSDSIPENQDPKADHLRPVRLLREYARYLAPNEGLLSADSWTIGATWIRNTILNLAILLLFFGGMILVPRALVHLLHAIDIWLETSRMFASSSVFWISVKGALPFTLVCAILYLFNLRFLGRYAQKAGRLSRGENDRVVLLSVVLPLLFVGYLYTAVIWNLNISGSPLSVASGFALVSVVGMLVLGGLLEDVSTLKFSIVAIASGLVSLIATYMFCEVLTSLGTNTMRGEWITVTLGAPLVMLVVTATIIVMLGFAGTLLSDETREWWSRLGAWLAISVLVWLGLCAICFFMPLWIAIASLKASATAAAAGITWATISAAGIKLAFSPKTANSETDRGQPWWKSWLLSSAPIVFVVGLLSLTSLLVFWAANRLIQLEAIWPSRQFPAFLETWFVRSVPTGDTSGHWMCCAGSPIQPEWISSNYWPLLDGNLMTPLFLAAVLLLLSKVLSWRVDVNEFSMHHFYRNRLVRAYLGSSRLRAHREPNAFTGFDPEDDLRLHRLTSQDLQTEVQDLITDCQLGYVGPFPILNTALNVTKGQDLGIQQRRAESFVFTPLWSGFDYARKQTQVKKAASLEFGFRRTSNFGDDAKGISVGTAMAISGAAFSSNAGYHTSPALAFLLTVFGVRLGWWAGNPRRMKWSQTSPLDGFSYLWKELMAATTTDEDFVLLTDGGHFENMGLYELVRRQCRFIVVSDAEQDEEFKLEGIGGAIRKCRNDFGVVINLNLEVLKPLGDPARSQLHYTVGTVRYPGEEILGRLVYIKASLTDDEPVDVVEFGKRHPEFPHTPTINQMFDESHFESYRELGHHVGSGVFRHDWPDSPASSEADLQNRLESMFNLLKTDWQKGRDTKVAGEPSASGGAR